MTVTVRVLEKDGPVLHVERENRQAFLHVSQVSSSSVDLGDGHLSVNVPEWILREKGLI